jgi:hypothetical protein
VHLAEVPVHAQEPFAVGPVVTVSLDEASPASVEFVRRGVKITVFGQFSDAVLRRVADSIP